MLQAPYRVVNRLGIKVCYPSHPSWIRVDRELIGLSSVAI